MDFYYTKISKSIVCTAIQATALKFTSFKAWGYIMKNKWNNRNRKQSGFHFSCTTQIVMFTFPIWQKVECGKGRCRVLLAQFRTGILPLSIETGHYQNIPIEFRHCLMCENNVCENVHFIFHCKRYDNIRQSFYNKLILIFSGFQQCSDTEKLNLVMNERIVKFTAQFISEAYNKRRDVMYSSF